MSDKETRIKMVGRGFSGFWSLAERWGGRIGIGGVKGTAGGQGGT